LEARSTKDHLAQQALVINHIKRLRSNPIFRDVPIIFIPEVGTGFQHTHLEQAVSIEQACYTLYQDNKSIPGKFIQHNNQIRCKKRQISNTRLLNGWGGYNRKS
jgi:hypothetical protein